MDIVMYSLGAASKVLGKIKQINLHRDLEDNENALLLNSRMSYPAGCELTPGELSCRLELNRYHAESCRLPICRGKTSRWSARKHAMQT